MKSLTSAKKHLEKARSELDNAVQEMAGYRWGESDSEDDDHAWSMQIGALTGLAWILDTVQENIDDIEEQWQGREES